MELSQQNIEILREMIAEPTDVVILSHTNPDGDAVGSSVAWAKALEKAGHRVTCIVPNRYPYYLGWMNGLDRVLIYNQDSEKAAEAVAVAKLIFCLDFHTISRLDSLSDVLSKNSSAKRILIDHHLDPSESCDLMFSHPE